MTPACIIGIGGVSGTGKTTLIERALPELKRQGLAVGVVKHAHHELMCDRRGKDTDRFYRAGADYVFAHDDEQGFLRFPCAGGGLSDGLARMPRGLDLLLVEGHKGADMARITLEKGKSRGSRKKLLTLNREDPDCLDRFLSAVKDLMLEWHLRRPVCGGLLMGGKSRRMGRPKGLLRAGGKTLMERSFETISAVTPRSFLLGSGDLPASMGRSARIPDVQGVPGPLGGMLAAFRWAPDSAWIVSAVDMPFMTVEAWKWLMDHRKPGVWAVLPRLSDSGYLEAAAALYEPMIFDYAESMAQRGVSALQAMGDHPKVIKPVVPPGLAPQWRNVNTMAQWKKASGELRRMMIHG